MKARTTTLTAAGTLLLTLAVLSPAWAQKGSFDLGVGAGLTKLDDKLGDDSGASLDLRAGYFVTDQLEIEIESALASATLEGSFDAYTLNLVYYFSGEREVVPYVLAGVGQAEVQDDALFVAPVNEDATAWRAAVGARFEIAQTGGLFSRAEISALQEDAFDDEATHVSLTLLFSWRFGS